MNKELTQEGFIALFPNTRFRYIHDSITGLAIQGSNVLDLSWNEKGYGIFFTVNGFLVNEIGDCVEVSDEQTELIQVTSFSFSKHSPQVHFSGCCMQFICLSLQMV